MKKIVILIFTMTFFISCGDDKVVLPRSKGLFNKVIVVTKASLWETEVGKEIKRS